jgi:hypothetical protein
VPGNHSCKPETVPATTASSNTVTPTHSVGQGGSHSGDGGDGRFPETLAPIYQTTRRHMPYDSNLQSSTLLWHGRTTLVQFLGRNGEISVCQHYAQTDTDSYWRPCHERWSQALRSTYCWHVQCTLPLQPHSVALDMVTMFST